MTDTTLTDDQIRVKAAEAMGIQNPIDISAGVAHMELVNLPDPLHDLNDAVALADKCDILWTIGKDEDTGRCSALAGTQEHEADSPARALTMAVLEALEQAEEISPC